MRSRKILVLAVLAVVGILAFFYFRREEPPPAAVPELFSLAPPDASALVYVDLAALRRSPFLAELLAIAPSPAEDAEYREFVAATGFDYSRDLDRALLALLPAASPATTVAVADGRFDREKIAGFAQRSGKMQKRNNAEVYLTMAGKPPRPIAFTFLAPGRILLTDSASLDPASFDKPHELPAEQRERVRRLGGAALIAMTRVDASQQNFSVFGYRSAELKRALRDVRWLSLAARPDGQALKTVIEAECVSKNAAKELLNAAEGLRLLARLLLSDSRTRSHLTPQTAALADAILRSSEFIQRDERVQMRFEISAKALAAPGQ